MPKGIPGHPVCSIEGCKEAVVARDWCSSHYQRWRRHGDPLGGDAMRVIHSGTPTQRFWAKVDKGGPVPHHRPELGPCWLWTAARDNGYGAFAPAIRKVPAHRFAYELLVGPIPEGLTLDHLCHNDSGCIGGPTCPHRRCVNPAHLEPVTIRENVLRGESFSAVGARRTHCPQGHPYDEKNTRIESSGGRRCRTCHRIQQQEERRRKAI